MIPWSKMKQIMEACRFDEQEVSTSDIALFPNRGTTVPETKIRHVYGFVITNQAASYNNVSIKNIPDGATGTSYVLRDVFVGNKENSGETVKNFVYPQNPDPFKPILALEGGAQLQGVAGVASVRITTLYWDDP